jgi:hypothetical protein
MAHKMRRIKSKMTEKFTDPKKMFNAMDKDGGGSLGINFPPDNNRKNDAFGARQHAAAHNGADADRKELAMGLFGLGIWLHPKELQCLLDILDKVGWHAHLSIML